MGDLSSDLADGNSLFGLSYELMADIVPLLVVALAAVATVWLLFRLKLINILIAILFVLSVVGISVDLIEHFNKNNIILEYLPKWIVFKWIGFLNKKLSYSLLVGVFISIVFNYYDKGRQAKRKDIYKKRLSDAYDSFKEEVLGIILSAGNESYDSNLVKEFFDSEKFQNYFEEDNNRREHYFAKQLDDERGSYRHDLIIAYVLFGKEISNILNANILINEKSYNYFRTKLKYINHVKLKYDNIIAKKTSFYDFDKDFIMRDIGQFLIKWNPLDSQSKEDLLKEAIQRM